jgi:hypothetical protein
MTNPSNRKKIYLHVAMPKSASTYLQEEIFPFLKDIHFTHLQYYIKDCPIANFILKARYANPITYDLEKKKDELWDYINSLKESKILISWEGLYGDPFGNHGNSLFLYTALKYIFPDASILFVTRKQSSLLDSLYKQSIHQYHSVSINSFLNYDPVGKQFLDYEPSWWQGINVDIRSFNMYAFVKKYRELFGGENVLVLPFELMLKDKRKFLTEIYDFIGVEYFFPESNNIQNQSYSKYTIGLALFLNKFMKKGFNTIRIIPMYSFLDPMVSLKKIDKIKYKKTNFINKELENLIMSYHNEDNKKLSEFVKVDLRQYGYYTLNNEDNVAEKKAE